jgi:hypothetical protein
MTANLNAHGPAPASAGHNVEGCVAPEFLINDGIIV